MEFLGSSYCRLSNLESFIHNPTVWRLYISEALNCNLINILSSRLEEDTLSIVGCAARVPKHLKIVVEQSNRWKGTYLYRAVIVSTGV